MEADVECLDCGYRWTSRIKAAPTKSLSRAPGWTQQLIAQIGEGIAELLLVHPVVGGSLIDTYLHERHLGDLQGLVDAGVHPTTARVAANGRGWFNRTWSEGGNPFMARFERHGTSETEYTFAARSS